MAQESTKLDQLAEVAVLVKSAGSELEALVDRFYELNGQPLTDQSAAARMKAELGVLVARADEALRRTRGREETARG